MTDRELVAADRNPDDAVQGNRHSPAKGERGSR